MVSDFFSKVSFYQLSFLLAIIPLIIFTGCDNTIEPLDEERGIYSFYGALDMKSDVNYIRVRNLNNPIRDGEIDDFDGSVTLTNLATAETQVLKDTLAEFDGVYVWNFETTLPIEPETVYEVAAENPEGKRVSATATTPSLSEADVLNDMPDCTTTVNIEIAPFNSGKIEADLGIEWLGQILWIPYRPDLSSGGNPEGAFNIQFTPLQLIEDVLDEVRWCHKLKSEIFHYRFTHFGPDFFKDTSSDPIIVPGGSGNFGAFHEERGSFRIDTSNVCFPFCPD